MSKSRTTPDAATAQLDDVLCQLGHHQVVDADLAKLVDDQRGVLQQRMLQRMLQQGRLATAQMTGENGDRDRLPAG